MTNNSDIDEIARAAGNFMEHLAQLRANTLSVSWYGWETISAVDHMRKFSGLGRQVFSHVCGGKKVADVGAADGDLGFFCESLGAQITFIDWPQTNFNQGSGLITTRAILKSSARLYFADLDFTPWLPGEYDLIFLLGIMYHVRNPGLIFNTLAHCGERLVLSTMVFFRGSDGNEVSDQQLAYFLECREIANEPTNYWLFTPTALRALLKRSGWIVRDEFFVGDLDATPTERDCRMWCYCERVTNWRDLRSHHDF